MCLLLLSVVGVAQSPNAAKRAPRLSATQRRVTEQIFAKEHAVWEAAKTRDMTQFKTLVAPDAKMIFTSGVRSRTEYIESMSSRQIKAYELTDFAVTTPAPNVAIASYLATISGVFSGNEIPPTTVREATVWLRRGSRWVAVLNQETPISH